MTDQHQERLYWDAASTDPANVGGVGMPPVEHFLTILDRFHVDGPMLDLGSGPGRLAVPMADFGHVHAVDISQAMLDQIPAHPNITTHLGNGRDLPDSVPPISFGWSVLMFQHIPRPAFLGYMHELWFHLRPGSRFIAQWVLKGEAHDYSHPCTASSGVSFGAAAGLELVEAWRDPLVDEWFWACWERP